MKFTPLFLALGCFVAQSQASILYDISTYSDFGSGNVHYEYSFTEPDFLTNDTIVPGSDLTLFDVPSCQISSASLHFGGGSLVVGQLFESPCYLSGDSSTLFGSFDHPGTYSNHSQLPTNVTITDLGSATPEPATFGSAGMAIAAVWWGIRRRRLQGKAR